MASCFNACGCGDFEGISKSDLDRFTDRIENVLTDETGRRLFRNFMLTSKLKDGLKCLDLWEECDAVINSPAARPADKEIYSEFLSEVDELIDKADRIEGVCLNILEKLTNTRDTEDREEIITDVKLLKNDVVKAMKTEYETFRKYYTTKKFF